MVRHLPKALSAIAAIICSVGLAQGSVIQFGDADVLGTTSYPSDPRVGATLEGLAPGVITMGAPALFHSYPFTPSGSDFPGTDQIYVGTNQTAFHEGYSQAPRLPGPQVITLDYSSLVAPGNTVQSLTLGIAADDFQNAVYGQPFTATLNGATYQPLTDLLNSLDQSGPVVRFFTIGLPLSMVNTGHTLTLSINQGGDGGDGWAIDFLTVGVTAVPAPGTMAAMGLLTLCSLARPRRQPR